MVYVLISYEKWCIVKIYMLRCNMQIKLTDLQDNKKEINGIEVLQWDENLLGKDDYLMVALSKKILEKYMTR